MATGATQGGGSSHGHHRVVVAPTTRSGRWAVGLAIAMFVLTPTWRIIPGGAALGFLAGLAGGPLALFAIVRRGERAVSVFVAFVPFALAVMFVLGELLIGHE